MAPTFRAMPVQCPITRTGTTSPLEVTVTPSQDQPAIGPGIIQAVHTFMEQAIPSILVHVEDSITTTAMDIRLMFRNETYGNVNDG